MVFLAVLSITKLSELNCRKFFLNFVDWRVYICIYMLHQQGCTPAAKKQCVLRKSNDEMDHSRFFSIVDYSSSFWFYFQFNFDITEFVITDILWGLDFYMKCNIIAAGCPID